jgi:alkylation response protein AidB-like acyl-CoA dehydrogenase
MTMIATANAMTAAEPPFDPLAVVRRLGPGFARRSRQSDESDAFVAENYAELKAAGLVEAGVPSELGGGGSDIETLCAMLRQLAHYCPSTALAFAMHTHQVAIPAWRWRHQKAPLEPLLKRIATEKIVLLTSGGSDWVAGTGKAEKVEGGYRITARKIFSSGAPAGDLLMTGAVLEEPGQPPMVVHFGVPMTSPQVRILDTWHTMGMRGTGSHDVMIDGHFVPEAAVALKRPANEWHMLFHIISMIAFPLIYAVYLGVAEGARDIAVELAGKRRRDRSVVSLVGQMETELRAAQFAHLGMLAAARSNNPSPAITSEIMIGRQLVARHAITSVEFAMEAAGGAGFYRDRGLEQRFRDIQGARYHPMQSGPQAEYAGSVALGLPNDKLF